MGGRMALRRSFEAVAASGGLVVTGASEWMTCDVCACDFD